MRFQSAGVAFYTMQKTPHLLSHLLQRPCAWTMACLFALLVAPLCTADAVGATEAEALSSGIAAASAPRIAAMPNGDCTVVWRETGSTGADILMARGRRSGVWDRGEIVCPTRKGVRLRQPVVTLDSLGTPHVVWVAQRLGGTTLEYTSLDASVPIPAWTEPLALGPESDLSIEWPVAVIRPTETGDTLFLAWQERRGSNYRIHALVLDAQGEARSILAGEDTLRYAIYPEILLLPGPPDAPQPVALVWFDLEEDQATVEARLWDDDVRAWRSWEPPEWNPQALQALPRIVAPHAATPVLIGYDTPDRFDRIFLSTDSMPLGFLDTTAQTHNRWPCVSQPGRDLLGLVWQEEIEGGIGLVQAALRSSGEVWSAPLALADAFLPPEPDVAVADEQVLSVWIAPWNETGEAARATVHFADSSLQDVAWRLILPAGETTAP